MQKRLWALSLPMLAAGLAGTAIAADQITGAGATFPAPIYQKWFGEFQQKHPDITINYQSLGSGAGIQQLTQGTVDFGASDMPMTDEQIRALKVKPLHFPTVLGGVVPTYNLPGVKDLKFSPESLAGIFLGKITKWSDPLLKKDNPGVNLPGPDIVVVHRSDGSGTTFVWVDYLSKVSPEWKTRVGASTSVKWPTGLGGKGNEGVAGQVKQTKGAIGYVELIYAVSNHMEYGAVRNAAGSFVKADFNSVTAAAAGAANTMPADFRVSITNAPGRNVYPISSFTWLLIPSKIPDAAKAKDLKAFLQWMLTDGQKDAAGMSYAPLPKEVVAKEMKQIGMIQ
jgi:phosphate transport system substrate-binding protein